MEKFIYEYPPLEAYDSKNIQKMMERVGLLPHTYPENFENEEHIYFEDYINLLTKAGMALTKEAWDKFFSFKNFQELAREMNRLLKIIKNK